MLSPKLVNNVQRKINAKSSSTSHSIQSVSIYTLWSRIKSVQRFISVLPRRLLMVENVPRVFNVFNHEKMRPYRQLTGFQSTLPIDAQSQASQSVNSSFLKW
jgi:hypothetical protein